MEQNTLSTTFVERKSKLAALQKLVSRKGKVPGVNKKYCVTISATSASHKHRNIGKTPHAVYTTKTKSGKKGCGKISCKTHSFHQVEDDSLMKAKIKLSEIPLKQTLLSAKTLSSRCILLHPSKIPPMSQLRSLALSVHSRFGAQLNDFRWSEGQLLWGKIRGYPFWPCMVSRDPFSKLFIKVVGSLKASRSYHVQFFGKETERSWINEASLLEFEGREKYLDIVQYGLENPQRNCKPPGEFIISPAWYPAWSLAVTEAEAASKVDVEERRSQYMFQYVVARGEAHKPVDELLKVIWYQSGGRMGGNDERSDNDDDASFYNKLFDTRGERPSYDSDDFYSSDDSSSCTEVNPRKCPVKIKVRQGLLEVFLTKHLRFIQERHPDWDPSLVVEYLKKQWLVMSNLQRSRYTTRHQKPVFVEIHRLKPHVSAKVDHVDNVDPLKLDLQIVKLSRKWRYVRSGKLCLVCEGQGLDLVCCKGACERYFHPACIQDEISHDSLCQECCQDGTACFACKKTSPDMVQCSHVKCKKYYHQVCVGQLKLTEMDKTGFVCPLHACVTCYVEERPGAREGSLVECLRCPTAYHSSNWCLVAGSQLIGKHHVLCASHFQPHTGCSQHSRVNIRWCLQCGYGGASLQQCQRCPAAFHEECEGGTSHISTVNRARLNMTLDSETSQTGMELWLCPHCLTGRKPLYGDIVWMKHGFYRWWPAEICHPHFVPKKVQVKRHQVGEFPVRFFGSHNFAWVHQGRVLSFDRGMTSCRDVVKNVKDQVFIEAVKEAAAAARFCASFDRAHQEM